MTKNKPALDAKAWLRVWEKFNDWYGTELCNRHTAAIYKPIWWHDRTKAIQRIVNAELRRGNHDTK